MLQSQLVSIKGFEHRSNKIQSLNAFPFVKSFHEGIGSASQTVGSLREIFLREGRPELDIEIQLELER